MAFKVIKEKILASNDRVAGEIKGLMSEKGIYMFNIISSPGAGKTSFLEKIGPVLHEEGMSPLVIAGDCYTSNDAERMDKRGIDVVQINTGNACHIDAGLIKKAIAGHDLSDREVVIVENVGNLVCPAEFDLGEDAKIAFLSTTEGDDKPEKYPLLISECDLAVINKTDLLDHVNFDMERCRKAIRAINPGVRILGVSCTSGDGLDGFVEWLKEKVKRKKEQTA